MLDRLFQPVFQGTFTVGSYLLCSAAALALGLLVAGACAYRAHHSKSFLMALALLPPIVQTVILLVNGNIGTGVAVMGAFSLVRFRSVPGTAKEIVSLFLAMAIGLATAMGYIGIAVLFALIVCTVMLLFTLIPLGAHKAVRELRITVPESLNYAHAFDDLFKTYAKTIRLISVKTSNMGSLYKLKYIICLKDCQQEQALIDALRCRNGNLEIALGMTTDHGEEL